MATITIVGASLAGVHAAQAIRKAGFDGEIIMVGEETERPYDRPPLSKQYLTSDFDRAKLALRPTAEDETLGLTWMLGRRSVSLDTTMSTVGLDDGTSVGYDGLVITTGARVRTLPASTGHEGLTGVEALRTLDDARRIREALTGGARRVLVCGAGFIGAEVAASARELGAEVTLVDLAPTPMARVLDPATGMEVAALHRDHGVDVRLEVAVDRLVAAPDSNQVGSAVLSDGTEIECDLVVVGIGVVPNTDWLEGSGLTVDNGVVTDEFCVAGPRIVAAGDVARWPNQTYGGRLMRVEQWDNAIDQGGYAGRRVLSEIGFTSESFSPDTEPFAPVPWFWSDQYDRKIQLAGITTDHPVLIQGSVQERQFVMAYLADEPGDSSEAVAGILCWNRPRQAIFGRQLIAGGGGLDDARERLG